MDLKEIEKQLEELQKIDFASMSPEQLQEIIDKIFDLTSDAETQLNKNIQTQANDSENS